MADSAAQEISVEGNRPIELYEWTAGLVSTRYNSSEGDFVFGGFTWLARTLIRNSFGKMVETEQSMLEVKMPVTDAIASQYVGIQPADRVDLVLSRVHEGASPQTALVIFRGFVTSFAAKDELATLSLKPFNELFQREMPRQTYQGLCNHVHYDSRCGVIESTSPNQLIGTVISQQNNGEIINVPGAGAVADNKSPAQAFKGGFVRNQSATDFRLVLDQDGDDLTLLLPFSSSVLGSEVVLQRGCDRSVVTCVSKYNNMINYGGFPHVPTTNPFGQGSFIEPATENEPAPVDLGGHFRPL